MKEGEVPKIKAIIFDIGGVQYFYDHKRASKPISRILKIPEEQIFYLLEQDKKFIDYREKKHLSSDYWNFFRKKLKLKKIPTRELNFYWNKIFYPNQKILKILPKLKKRYKLGIISNLSSGHKRFLLSRGVVKPFNTSIFSCDYNLRKPNPRIYKIALEELGVKPHETLFVDDLSSNIRGANKLGIHGIVYKNHETFLKKLKKWKILQ